MEMRSSYWFRRFGIPAVIAALILTVAACGGSDSSSDSGSESTATSSGGATTVTGDAPATGLEDKKIAFVTAGDVIPYTKVENHALIDALEAEGAKVTYLQDPYDPQVHLRNFNAAVAQKPDLIINQPLDPNSIVPAVKKARQAGIPIIMLNQSPPAAIAGDILTKVSPDDDALARFAAQNIAEGLRKQGRKSANVLVVAGPNSSPLSASAVEIFKDELNKIAPEYKVVDELQIPDFAQATTRQTVQPVLAKWKSQGGIGGIYTFNDDMAAGVIQAADAVGLPVGVDKKDGIIVSGARCSGQGIKSIQAGIQYGTATQAAVPEALFAADVVKKWAAGETLPKEMKHPEDRVTKDNVAEFAKACSW